MVFSGAIVLKTGYDLQYRDAGEWIRQDSGGGKNIMARWESTSAYYSGGVAINLPYAEFNRITDFARSRDVDYLRHQPAGDRGRQTRSEAAARGGCEPSGLEAGKYGPAGDEQGDHDLSNGYADGNGFEKLR